jgi:hypothetical protein
MSKIHIKRKTNSSKFVRLVIDKDSKGYKALEKAARDGNTTIEALTEKLLSNYKATTQPAAIVENGEK